jgi:hypothetical protein
VKNEISDLRGRLRLEEMEEELRSIKSNNAKVMREKEKLQQDLRIAS